MAQVPIIVVAALVLIRVSLVLAGLSFLVGILGALLAVIAVRTSRAEQVSLPVYPFGGSRIRQEDDLSSLVPRQEAAAEKRQSRFSFQH